jgi:dTDP-4-dehydrorhamnose reductase
MVKTAVIGASGYVGRHLWGAYRAYFPDCVGTRYANTGNQNLRQFDLRHPILAKLGLEKTGHGAVVIASAKANVAYCECNPREAYALNVSGTLDLVRQVAEMGLQVIFLSSDYVFDGKCGPYEDLDPTNPTNEYGRQKAEVEGLIPTLTDNFLILRLSKIYGMVKGDGTLLDEMASALFASKRIAAARDQIFCPTHIDDLVGAVLSLQELQLRGVFNVCNPERWSRADIAHEVAGAIGADAGLIDRINLYDLPGMQGRPLDTSMRPARLMRDTKVTFVPLGESLRRLADLWRTV